MLTNINEDYIIISPLICSIAVEYLLYYTYSQDT